MTGRVLVETKVSCLDDNSSYLTRFLKGIARSVKFQVSHLQMNPTSEVSHSLGEHCSLVSAILNYAHMRL